MGCEIGGGKPVHDPRHNTEEEKKRQDVKDLCTPDEKDIDDGQLYDIVAIGTHHTNSNEAEKGMEFPIRTPHDEGASDSTAHSQEESRG